MDQVEELVERILSGLTRPGVGEDGFRLIARSVGLTLLPEHFAGTGSAASLVPDAEAALGDELARALRLLHPPELEALAGAVARIPELGGELALLCRYAVVERPGLLLA